MGDVSQYQTAFVAGVEVRMDSLGRISANDLHKASGGNPKDRPSLFLENKKTKELVDQLEESKAGIPALPKESVLRVVHGNTEGQGTWMCEELAYSYIAWISPEFNAKAWTAVKCLTQYGVNSGLRTVKQGLVTFEGSDLWVSARDIADVFGKSAYHVNRDISNAIGEIQAVELELSSEKINPNLDVSLNSPKLKALKAERIIYTDSMNRPQSTYRINRPLFNYIVLNYTGENANKYRYMFIQQFEALDENIKVMLAKQELNKSINKQQVYVFKNELSGFVKIGISNNPTRRKTEIENASGCDLAAVYVSPVCKNALEIEQAAHKHFSENRGRGEWFDIDTETVIDFISSYGYDFGELVSIQTELLLSK